MRLWFISDLNLDNAPRDELFNEWSHAVRKGDKVFLLGNIAVNHKSFWFSRIHSMPGDKALFLGNLETNRPAWYHKFGVNRVIAFNETKIINSAIGPVLLSHLPAYPTVMNGTEPKYLGLMKKFETIFDLNSCVLNIHGHSAGHGQERHNTFDASYREESGQKLLMLDQIIEHKFKSHAR